MPHSNANAPTIATSNNTEKPHKHNAQQRRADTRRTCGISSIRFRIVVIFRREAGVKKRALGLQCIQCTGNFLFLHLGATAQ